MKKIFSVTVVLLLAVTLTFCVSAQKYGKYGSLGYQIKNNEVIITGFDKSEANIDIPAVIEGYPVTEIANEAFTHSYISDDVLVSITIPGSVRCIGVQAFSSNNNLKSLEISEGVKYIRLGAFSGCTSLESLKIPNSAIIDPTAFSSCTSLKSITVEENNPRYSIDEHGVLFNKEKTELIQYPCGNTATSYTIPDSVTKIHSSAFYYCTNLKSITIPDSVMDIGSFGYCTSLTSIILPDGLTYIGRQTFSGCTSLTSVTIPDSVTSIYDGAFLGCKSLVNIQLSNNIKTIKSSTFSGCASLKRIEIPDSVSSINSSAFSGCASLESIEIPDSVLYIGDYAFSGCASLESITFGVNSKFQSSTLGENTFAGCTSLKSIKIPNSVTRIDDGVFKLCTSLESVEIPDSVTLIRPEAFQNCTNLSDIFYYGSKEQWKKITVYYDNNSLYDATIHYNSTGANIGKLQISGEQKLQAQKSTTLTATYTDNNGKVDSSGSITWSCSDATVLQIMPSGNTATVKGLKAGKATVTATHSSGATESVEIEVKERQIKVFVNNKQVEFYPQEPYLDEAAGRTLVPVRQILEAMGATVDWDEENQIVKIQYLNRYILLFIDKYTMFVNGKSKPLDIVPKIMNGRTMIPVRAVAEACDCEVVWDEVNYHIYITVDENKENSLLNITCENKTYNGNLNSPDMVSASISVENMSSDIVVVVLNGEGNKVIKAKDAKDVTVYLSVPGCMNIIDGTKLSLGDLKAGSLKTKSVDIRFNCYKNSDCKNSHVLEATAVAEGFDPIDCAISVTKPKYVDPFDKLREEAQKANVDRATQAVKIADTLCENTQNKLSTDKNLSSYREIIKNEITIDVNNDKTVSKDTVPDKIYDIFFRKIKTALDEARITKFSIDPIKLTNQVVDMIQKGLLSHEDSFEIDGVSYSINIHGTVNSGNGYAICTVNRLNQGYNVEYDIIWSNYGSEESLNGIKEFANALDKLNTDLWKDACAKLVSDGLGLSGFENITPDKVTKALNTAEKIVYALCDEKAADKLLDELGGKMKEELKTWRGNEFEKFVSNYVPNGDLLVDAAEKYKDVANKYHEWEAVLYEGSDLNKAIQIQNEFEEAYEALNSILLDL